NAPRHRRGEGPRAQRVALQARLLRWRTIASRAQLIPGRAQALFCLRATWRCLRSGGERVAHDRMPLARKPVSLARDRVRLARNPDSLGRDRERLAHNPDSLAFDRKWLA